MESTRQHFRRAAVVVVAVAVLVALWESTMSRVDTQAGPFVYAIASDVDTLHHLVSYDSAISLTQVSAYFPAKGGGAPSGLVASSDLVNAAVPPAKGSDLGNAEYEALRWIVENEHALYALDVRPSVLAERLGLDDVVAFDPDDRPFPMATDAYFDSTTGAITGTAIRFVADDGGWVIGHDRRPKVSDTVPPTLDDNGEWIGDFSEMAITAPYDMVRSKLVEMLNGNF